MLGNDAEVRKFLSRPDQGLKNCDNLAVNSWIPLSHQGRFKTATERACCV